MGGTGGYARPVEPTGGRMASWLTHTNRGVPSTEPGVDYFCPIGTPIRSAASGVVVDVGTSIMPATGRYITVDLDDGRRVRYLHILRHKVGVGTRVRWGQHIADSGATGYGEQDWSWNVAGTGGAHVHMTLFRDHSYRFGRYATLDPEQYMAPNQSGGNSTEDDMTPEQANQLNQIYKAVFKGGPSMSEGGNSIETSLARIMGSVKPINRDGKQVALRQEVADTKTMMLELQASQAGLEAALTALANAKGLDPDAILKAAQQGVERGLRNVTFTVDIDG
jgi:hypothetical protein